MNMPRDTAPKQKTNRHIAVKPTKYSFNEDRLEEIDRISSGYGLSFSEYFRNMLTAYFEMPQYRRERVYYFGKSTTPDRLDQTRVNCLSLFDVGYTD